MSTNDRMGMAVNSCNLKHVSGRMRDVDVLGAMAYAGGLGDLLHRIKDGGCKRSLIEASELLEKKLKKIAMRKRWALKGVSLRKVAEIAIAEFTSDKCDVCNGVGRMLLKWYEHDAEKTKDEVCNCCKGSGIRRNRWSDRWMHIGADKNDDWKERFDVVHQIITDEYDRVSLTVHRQLHSVDNSC